MKKINKVILIAFLILPIFSLRAENENIFIPEMICADGKGPWLAESLEDKSWPTPNEAKNAGERYARRIKESGGPSGCKVNDVFLRNQKGSLVRISEMSANDKKRYSNGRNNYYDGTQPLECDVNVNCSNKSEVVTKMSQRWTSFSASTLYSRVCLESISRVKNIPDQIYSAGLASAQIATCNLR